MFVATHQTIRTITSHGHQYRQRVELYYDPEKKQTRARILESLGPTHPIRRRPSFPQSLPMEPVHFGLLATRMMTGSLTAAQVVQTVHDMGEEMPPGLLLAAGIRFDLGEKTLELLLWLELPSSRPRTARSVMPPPKSKGLTPRPSSRSKDSAR